MKKRNIYLIKIVPIIGLLAVIHPLQAERGRQRIAVIVDPDIYNLIESDLNIYAQDIQNIGYSVITMNTKWENAFALRSTLQSQYQKGLVGCVLVGKVPIPHFYRDKKSEPRPCVLALMDLNGVWKKNPRNSHYIETPPQPDIFPEIWVGVIAPNSSRESQVKQLKRYFEKLHLFRTAGHPLPKEREALSFDELTAKPNTMGLDVLYGDDVVVVSDPNETSPIRLLKELRKNYEFVAIQAHNSGGFTGLDIRDQKGKRYDFGIREFKRARPNTSFYSLYSCSVSCPTKTDYLGGSLIFETPGGALVHGTTMPGGMNCPEIIYKTWLTSGSFGEAFKMWFTHEIPRDKKATKRRWYLGAIVLGDPTLNFPHGP